MNMDTTMCFGDIFSVAEGLTTRWTPGQLLQGELLVTNDKKHVQSVVNSTVVQGLYNIYIYVMLYTDIYICQYTHLGSKNLDGLKGGIM